MKKPIHKSYTVKKVGKRNKSVIERLYIGSAMLWINWSNTMIVSKILEVVKTIEEFNLYQRDLTEFLGVGRYTLVRSEFAVRSLKEIATAKVLSKEPSCNEQKKSKQPVNDSIEYITLPVEIICSTSSSTKFRVVDKAKEYDFMISTKVENFPSRVSFVRFKDQFIVDEYWLYKHCKLYELNSEYIFRVKSSQKHGKARLYVLRDKLAHEQSVVSHATFNDGDTIICTVRGFQRTKKHLNSLLLMNARLHEGAHIKSQSKARTYTTPAPYYPNGKQPEAWLREVEGLGKHTATSAFKCSCCGRNFSARQGCKIEFRDIYFCKACADQIFKHSEKGYVHIVYTPMGNKR